MSITSEELNYIIWRYCQEAGHEVSALALQDETRVLEFDEKYKDMIPLGTLVNLVQRGLLYTESELLVKYNGEVKPIDEDYYKENFNLVQALQINKDMYPEIAADGRFVLEHDSEHEKFTEALAEKSNTDIILENSKVILNEGNKRNIAVNADNFIKTLTEVQELGFITVSSWNPIDETILAYGDRNCVSKIVKFHIDAETSLWSVSSTHELRHPFALTNTSSDSTNKVTALAWSPNGENIVTGVENGELRIWNKEGKLQNVLNFHRAAIVAIKWNASGNYLISCDIDNVTILWNSQSGTALQHFELKELSSSSDSLGVDLEWVDNDRFVIPGIDSSIVVYNVDENKPLGRLLGHQRAISVLEMNPKTKLLLSASDDHTLRVWKGGSSNSSNCFYGHSQSIISASWIDDTYLLSSSMDGSIRVWSRKNNSLVGVAVADDIPIFASALSPDKSKYAVGFMDGQIIIYNIKSVLEKLNATDHEDDTQSTNNTNGSPRSIPIHGSYQCSKDGDCIFDISWNKNSNAVSIAYSIGAGIIITI